MVQKEKVIEFLEGSLRDFRRRGVTIGIIDDKGNIINKHWEKDRLRQKIKMLDYLYDDNLKHRNGIHQIIGVKDYDGTLYKKGESDIPKEEDVKKKKEDLEQQGVYKKMERKSSEKKKVKPESSLVDKDGNVEFKESSKKPTKTTKNTKKSATSTKKNKEDK